MWWCLLLVSCCFFFFKQKTAYEMRISDWSSDVCSSDLGGVRPSPVQGSHQFQTRHGPDASTAQEQVRPSAPNRAHGDGMFSIVVHRHAGAQKAILRDRKSVV